MIDTFRKLAAANPPKDLVMEVKGGVLRLQLTTTINSQLAKVSEIHPLDTLPTASPSAADNEIADYIDGLADQLDAKAEGRA